MGSAYASIGGRSGSGVEDGEMDPDPIRIESPTGLTASFVPEAGMVCTSLEQDGEQLLGLRNGLAAYVERRSTMGIPLLYPWANRLAGQRFELAGRTVDLSACEPPPKLDESGLPIHGLLTGVAGWEVVSSTLSDHGGELVATFDFDGRLAAGFPFPHSLTYRAHLRGPRLAITLRVDADRGPVPVAFGFHPYFSLPGVPRSEWRLTVPVSRRLELDDRGLPTGVATNVEAITGALGERTFDDAFAAPSGGGAFVLAGGERRVEVEFDAGYPYAQLYAPPGEDLIAWEPMTAPTNALVDGDHLTILDQGESYEATFAVTVTGADG